MLCTELAIYGSTPQSLHAHALHCKSWLCPYCGERNRRRLIGLCIDGEPTTLLTLTTNPAYESDPIAAADNLYSAWQRLIRRLRRDYGRDRIAYIAIWERTQRGMPHLHILMRAPYIPQHRISAEMDAMISAPIVDIRKVTNTRQVARYVGKYVSKDPARWPGHNRFARSRNWRETATAKRNQWTPPEDILWEVVHLRLDHLADILRRSYRVVYDDEHDRLTAYVQTEPRDGP